MKNSAHPSFDQEKFDSQFQGMADIGQQAIDSFLKTYPELMDKVSKAILAQNAADLEIAAHTLKGVVSIFFAEPSRLLAFKLEQLGREKKLTETEKIFSDLKTEIDHLVVALSEVVK